jgi:hypothetical protein
MFAPLMVKFQGQVVTYIVAALFAAAIVWAIMQSKRPAPAVGEEEPAAVAGD